MIGIVIGSTMVPMPAATTMPAAIIAATIVRPPDLPACHPIQLDSRRFLYAGCARFSESQIIRYAEGPEVPHFTA
jgi:hypothetical protein